MPGQGAAALPEVASPLTLIIEIFLLFVSITVTSMLFLCFGVFSLSSFCICGLLTCGVSADLVVMMVVMVVVAVADQRLRFFRLRRITSTAWYPQTVRANVFFFFNCTTAV